MSINFRIGIFLYAQLKIIHLVVIHHQLSFFPKLLFAHTPICRAWRQRTTTPPLPPMTPCWCLTTRAAAPTPAPSAPCTLSRAAATRTMTTWESGGRAFASWPTCTVEGTTRPPQHPPPPHRLLLQGSVGSGGVEHTNIMGILDGHHHGLACKETGCPLDDGLMIMETIWTPGLAVQANGQHYLSVSPSANTREQCTEDWLSPRRQRATTAMLHSFTLESLITGALGSNVPFCTLFWLCSVLILCVALKAPGVLGTATRGGLCYDNERACVFGLHFISCMFDCLCESFPKWHKGWTLQKGKTYRNFRTIEHTCL